MADIIFNNAHLKRNDIKWESWELLPRYGLMGYILQCLEKISVTV